MKASNIFVATVMAISLVACGGGGSSNPVPTPTPTPTPVFQGADVTIEGVPSGFVKGSSEEMVVRNVANAIVAKPENNPAWYPLLLSDKGLKVVAGTKTFVVKLTNNGLVIVQV